VVEQGGELSWDLGPSQVNGRSKLGIDQDPQLGMVELNPGGGLVAGDHVAGDLEDSLRHECPEALPVALVSNHHLGDALFVADQEERDLGKTALVVQPARQLGALADVVPQISRPSPSHPLTSIQNVGPRCAGEGKLAVPPHFVTAEAATSLAR
jgi:hypothetical protein